MKVGKIISVFVAMAFIGCASLPVGSGDKQDPVPPKIITGKDNSKIWDRPSAFGPVPDNLVETGKKTCGPMGMKAVGYHAKAQDENGKEFPGGGYLCVPNE